ncbi:extracellular solute-binding protein [Histidinibacterium aquaticum]|uniref:Extracellular solute-binding protein n=1 Tax=Histidinibacterium aquaticum TaxID=2613962 RepID=A0A5J5GPG7_9RHOB|nr:extracellular solute-binding protein [Histidinibacterium aquaticum]KAA9010229.1 extracellular solute-binding protein [Histidinibacterium aquaticum]
MAENIQIGQAASRQPAERSGRTDLAMATGFLEELMLELGGALEPSTPDPYLGMSLHLLRSHLDGRIVTPSSMVAAAGVPYATAVRRLADMQKAGLIEQRPRSKTGKSFSLHPSEEMLSVWAQLSDRILRLGRRAFVETGAPAEADYYFGGSYIDSTTLIPPPQVLQRPLRLAGGLRILVHGDPTFMVMDNLKRQFEQLVGAKINQRAFSIDRLREEAIRNAARPQSRYDLIAVDLPWVGEFVARGVLAPLDEMMEVSRLDPGDFHTAGWRAAHWMGRPYGVPAQTTPELMFYRRDLFAEAGLEPPTTTGAVLEAARALHDPRHGRYGIAWNAARGTALGHTFMMACADFGQPILDMQPIAGGYDADWLGRERPRVTIDTERGLAAAEYLMDLMDVAPPDILSMSWYERVRPYAEGKVAMAYGYTLLAPYFELDPASPANGTTGYLPHPHGPGARPVAPVGGYVLGIPANLAPDRRAEAAEALIAFTSPEAQKLYIQNGSRTSPRYSVGADPEVRRLSPIFEAVDQMSWRDELQFWPRPPIPEISEIIRICGEEFHDMLRGVVSPRQALRRAQERAEAAIP